MGLDVNKIAINLYNLDDVFHRWGLETLPRENHSLTGPPGKFETIDRWRGVLDLLASGVLALVTSVVAVLVLGQDPVV